MATGWPTQWVKPRNDADIHGREYDSQSRENPTVHSKSTRRYGGQGTEQPTREIPGTSNIAPSAPVAHEHPYAMPKSQTVGWSPDGSGKYTRPSYPLRTKKASGDGVQHERGPTVGAAGQAHAASGGKFGKPQRGAK